MLSRRNEAHTGGRTQDLQDLATCRAITVIGIEEEAEIAAHVAQGGGFVAQRPVEIAFLRRQAVSGKQLVLKRCVGNRAEQGGIVGQQFGVLFLGLVDQHELRSARQLFLAQCRIDVGLGRFGPVGTGLVHPADRLGSNADFGPEDEDVHLTGRKGPTVAHRRGLCPAELCVRRRRADGEEQRDEREPFPDDTEQGCDPFPCLGKNR